MTATWILAFSGVAMLAYVTPGPDWFVVMRHARDGRRRGFVAALGVQSGLVVHMTAAAFGVAAVLLASAEAFTMLKLVGAAYLLFLGVQSLRRALGPTGRTADMATADRPPLRSVYRQSMLANVVNPKAALFFVAVLPQFVDTSAPLAPQVLLLGTLDVALGLLWWLAFVGGVSRLSEWLGRRARIVDGVSGVGLIGLGGALAFAHPART